MNQTDFEYHINEWAIQNGKDVLPFPEVYRPFVEPTDELSTEQAEALTAEAIFEGVKQS